MKNLLTIFERSPTIEAIFVVFGGIVAFVLVVIILLKHGSPEAVLTALFIGFLICFYRVWHGLDQ